MQSVSSRIWTRVTVSISNDDNHCTMGTDSGTIGVYEFELGNNAVKATKNICCAKVKGAVIMVGQQDGSNNFAWIARILIIRQS